MFKDLYEVLGVSSNASLVEIKRAYRQLALKYHPDKISNELLRNESEARFKEVTAAYEILSDDSKRSRYTGCEFNGHFTEDDFMNFFRYGFGRYENFDEPNKEYKEKKMKSKDDDIPLKLTTKELYLGKTFQFQAKRNILCLRCCGTGLRRKKTQRQPQSCENCEGSGFLERICYVGRGLITRERLECTRCEGKGTFISTNSKDKCRKCHGKYVIEEESRLTVHVPRGSRHGDKIRLHGLSDMEPGKETGDIVFYIEEHVDGSHDVDRKGMDLYTCVKYFIVGSVNWITKLVAHTFDDIGVAIVCGQGSFPGKCFKLGD